MARLRSPHAARALLLAAGAALALGSCGGDEQASAEKVRVVAAFSPLQEAAQRIGGDRVAVTNLTPVGGQPHDLQPSAEGLAALRSAKVVLTFGTTFQPAVTEGRHGAPGQRRAGRPPGGHRPPPTDEADRRDEGSRRRTLRDGRGSPHLGRAGAVRDDRRRRARRARARRSGRQGRLRAAGREIPRAATRARRPVRHGARDLRVAGDPRRASAFAYLAKAYGLRQAVVAGLSPASRPDPASLAATKAYARRVDADTLFFGGPVPPRLARAIASGADVEAQTLNPVEGLTQDQIDRGDTYVSLMQANLRVLVDGLRCTPGT